MTNITLNNAATASTSSTVTTEPPSKRRKMRSWVVTNGWVKLVTINGDVNLRCTICRQDFNYASNSTSAAMRHVQKHHRATETSSPEANSRQQSSIHAAF